MKTTRCDVCHKNFDDGISTEFSLEAPLGDGRTVELDVRVEVNRFSRHGELDVCSVCICNLLREKLVKKVKP